MQPAIADRLHDGPIQSLTAGSMWLLLARRKATDPDMASLLERAQEAVAESIRDIRLIMDGRSPIDSPPATPSIEKEAI